MEYTHRASDADRRDPLLLGVYARWAQAAEDKHFLMLAARCHLAAFQVRKYHFDIWLGSF